MKKFTLLLFIIPALLFSCDKIEEANTIEIDTTLSMDIPVSVESPTAMVLKSAAVNHTFSESKTYSLGDNDDISDYLSKIQDININDFVIVFSGLGEGEVLNTVEISVTGAGVLASFQNVTNTNPSPTPTLNAANIAAAASLLNNTKQIVVVVSGNANTAPMDFTVNMDFDVTVEAKVL